MPTKLKTGVIGESRPSKCIDIYTSSTAPSPKGEGWDDDCMDAGGRATHGAVAEGNVNA